VIQAARQPAEASPALAFIVDDVLVELLPGLTAPMNPPIMLLLGENKRHFNQVDPLYRGKTSVFFGT